MSANNTFIKDSLTGTAYDNLFTNLTLPGTLRLTNVSPKSTETEVLHINPATGIVVRGTASGANDSGFSYINTTSSTILNIPTTVSVVPVAYAVSPSITYSFNWKQDWDILASPTNNNRFVYQGVTPKKFVMDIDMSLTVALGAGTINLALYRGGSAILAHAQTVGILGAINPTIETLSISFPFTANQNDFFELYIYGLTTGVSIQPVTASLFSPSTQCSCISIECREVKI